MTGPYFPEVLYGKDTYQGHKQIGAGSYPGITFATIAAMAAQPPSIAEKPLQSWFIPSSYRASDGRAFQAQQASGSFHILVADADAGDHSAGQVAAAVRAAFGDVWYLAYETFNSCNPGEGYEGKRRWRILVPLANTIPGLAYRASARAFRAMLTELGGLAPTDLTASRFGQISYLPNRGPYSYSHVIGGTYLCDLQYVDGFNQRALAYWHEEQEQAATESGTERLYTPRWTFSRYHTTEDLLIACHFQQEPDGKWRWPGQHSKGSLVIWPDGKWNTKSGTAADSGCGRRDRTGGTYGDAFDLWVHFYQVHKDAADCYAKALSYGHAPDLDPAAAWRYLKDLEAHGLQVWEAMQQARYEESAALAEAVRQEAIQVDSNLMTEGEWDLDWPPGLVGEVAKWIYLSSSRPIKQYAIAAALYFFSVAGRKYNVDGSGLNLFILLVGETGRGKGVVKTAVDKLVAAIMMEAQNPHLTMPFNYEIAVSESGMRKALSKQNPICAYEEELGLTLLPLTSAKAGANEVGLRKMLTRLYDSGEGRMLGKKEASDADRARDMVSMPCMTIAGDTQPHVYRGLLGSSMIDSGFGPRMLQFFYYGKRKHHNEASEDHRYPPAAMVKLLKVILEYCLTSGESINAVKWAAGVKDLHNAFGIDMDNRINQGQPGGEMLNRAGATVARVAGLLAVGENHLHPVITEQCYTYARTIVEIGLEETQRILKEGGAGSGESVRIYKLREAVRRFITGVVNVDTKLRTYKTPKAVVDSMNIINEGYLLTALGNQADFKGGDTRTTEQNVREAIKEALAQGIIETATVLGLDKRTKQAMYQIGPDF